jgi:hypothetical protein
VTVRSIGDLAACDTHRSRPPGLAKADDCTPLSKPYRKSALAGMARQELGDAAAKKH